MRLSENEKLVERIVIKIKVFDTGKFDWKVRQRFIKEPRLKIDDILTILDGVKAEILAGEGSSEQPQATEPISDAAPGQQTPGLSKKKNKKKKNTTT